MPGGSQVGIDRLGSRPKVADLVRSIFSYRGKGRPETGLRKFDDLLANESSEGALDSQGSFTRASKEALKKLIEQLLDSACAVEESRATYAPLELTTEFDFTTCLSLASSL